MPRIVFADGKGVQLRTEAEQDSAAQEKRQEQQLDLVIVDPGEGTEGPVAQGAGMVTAEGDEQRDNAGNEHGKDDADQDDAAGAQRTIQSVGQGQDQDQRAKGKDHGRDHGAAVGGTGNGDSGHDGDDRAQGCAGGNAHGGTVRQGIAQQPLHGGAAYG